MFKLDFAPGTVFVSRREKREFYIKVRSGIIEIPYGWVRTHSINPPSITLMRDIKFRVTRDGKPALHTSHKEFAFEPDDFVAVTNITTGEKVWPVQKPPTKRGFKWL